MSINSVSSPQAGDVISDSQYCDLELSDDTYGWEKDTSSGETQWVYKPGEVQSGETTGGDSSGAADAGAATVNGGSEDNSVENNIGTETIKDPTQGVETSALTDEEKAQLENTRNELAALNKSIEDNNNQLNGLEIQITVLQDEIEENINEAIQKSEEIAQEQKEDAQEAVKKNLNAYTNANGDMTYEEFMNNLSKDLNGISREANSKLTSAVRRIIEAESKFSTLNGLLSTMNGVITENKNLSEQAQGKQTEIQTLVTKVTEKKSNVDKDVNTNIDDVTKAMDFDEKQATLTGRTSNLEALEATALQNLGMDKAEIQQVSEKISSQAQARGENIENVFEQWHKEEAEEKEREENNK